MVAIIDYGASNLLSVKKAFEAIGAPCAITSDHAAIAAASRVVLPGVGHFSAAMKSLKQSGLADTVREVVWNGTPLLGICLGLQLLFEDSEEAPGVRGLGLLPGHVVKIPSGEGFKVPHVGWNSLEITGKHSLFQDVPQGSHMYFVHSYYLKCTVEPAVAARTTHSVGMDVAVQHANICATQFHPEKSGALGLCILKNFAGDAIAREVPNAG